MEADLQGLIDVDGVDVPELERRRELLRLYRENRGRSALEFAGVEHVTPALRRAAAQGLGRPYS